MASPNGIAVPLPHAKIMCEKCVQTRETGDLGDSASPPQNKIEFLF